jgi:predicted ester cyclase
MATVVSVNTNNAVIYRLFNEIFNQENISLLDEITTSNYVLEAPGVETERGIQEGLEVFKQRITSLRTAFPDIQYTVEEIVADGNKVGVTSSFTGTHKGEFAGIAATGRQLKATELYFIQLNDNKIERLRLAPFGSNVVQLLRA